MSDRIQELVAANTSLLRELNKLRAELEECKTGIATEREACAELCEAFAPWGNMSDDWAAKNLHKAAAAIRARGQQP